MGADLERALEERWAEYEQLRDSGETHSALVRLAEVENCLEHQAVRRSVTRKWESMLRDAALSSQDVELALAGIVAAVKRLRRMLNVGTRFVYEELMLAITMRVELDLLVDFLARRGFADVAGPEILALDEDLIEIAHSKKHRSAFSSAQAAARRNWGIPLQTRWLL